MRDDLVLDGNGLAALLDGLVPGDVTGVLRRCPACADESALGAHRAYRGAGVVLRCPSCGAAAVVAGVHADRLTVRAEGTFTVPRDA
jgi:ribosomal protein S27AE